LYDDESEWAAMSGEGRDDVMHIYRRIGEIGLAARHFARALELVRNEPERRHLLGRQVRCLQAIDQGDSP